MGGIKSATQCQYKRKQSYCRQFNFLPFWIEWAWLMLLQWMQLLKEKQIQKTMTFHAGIKCKALCQKRSFFISLIMSQLSVTLFNFKAGTSSIAFPTYLIGTTVDSRLFVHYNYIGWLTLSQGFTHFLNDCLGPCVCLFWRVEYCLKGTVCIAVGQFFKK